MYIPLSSLKSNGFGKPDNIDDGDEFKGVSGLNKCCHAEKSDETGKPHKSCNSYEILNY